MAEWRLGLPYIYFNKALYVFIFVLSFNLPILKAYSCWLHFIALPLTIVLVFTLNSVYLRVLLSFKVFGINFCKYSDNCFYYVWSSLWTYLLSLFEIFLQMSRIFYCIYVWCNCIDSAEGINVRAGSMVFPLALSTSVASVLNLEFSHCTWKFCSHTWNLW